MRVFLRFSEGANIAIDPNHFAARPTVRRFYPNFLTLDFQPLENLQAAADFWVPESHAVAGRVTLINKTTAVRIIPALGKAVGDRVEFGGLLGSAPVMPVSAFSSAAFIQRGGRIPAPVQSMRN